MAACGTELFGPVVFLDVEQRWPVGVEHDEAWWPVWPACLALLLVVAFFAAAVFEAEQIASESGE